MAACCALLLWLPAMGQARPLADVVEELAESAGPAGRVAWVGVGAHPDMLARVKAWLFPLAVDTDALAREVRFELEDRFAVLPSGPMPANEALQQVRGGDLAPNHIVAATRAMGADSIVVAFVEPSFDFRSATVSLRLLSGSSADDAWVAGAAVSSPGALSQPNPIAIVAYLAAVGLILFRRYTSVTGSLVVKLPEDCQSKQVFTTIFLTTSSFKGKGLPSTSTARYSRSMVPPISQFDDVQARHYYVCVQRLQRDPETNELVDTQYYEKEVEVKRGETARVRFSFQAAQLGVGLELRRGGESVDERVLVAIAGRPGEARYMHTDGAQLKLSEGEHTVLLGVGDSALEQSLQIDDATLKHTLSFDADSEEQLLFSGCASAVELYLNGDIESALRDLEAAGQEERAHVLRARLLRKQGETHVAAQHLEAAGHLTEAAELTSDSDDDLRAAALFEQAGEQVRAAESYRRGGDIASAMRVYEEIGDFNNAVSCAMCMGDQEKALDLLEKSGLFLDAARIATSLDRGEHGIRLLQQIPSRDAKYGEACTLLADLFFQRSEFELALQKLDEAAQVEGEDSELGLRERIGLKLEEEERFDLALEAFETIRKRDIHYPGVADRIESLREKLRTGSAPAVAPAPAAAPAESRYELLGEIGRGAMGVVLKARDTRLGRIVALKKLPENLKEHPTAVKLFLREARSAAALNHPNIVTLYDADQEDGMYYLTMEYLEGLPVDQLLRERGGALDLRETLTLGLQTAMGLDYAHEQNIVHRDIKPSNLFFTKNKKLKIMDFGLAKMVEEVRKKSSVIAGTPHFMAPEQAMGDAVDHRADLYAFGVTLFQFVTGQLPFNEGDVIYHHRHTPPPDPRELCVTTPDELAELILKLMAKDPRERFASTSNLRRGLGKMLKNLGSI